MPRRTRLNPIVSFGHHNYTGMTEAVTGSDAPHVRVSVPELAWLQHVHIEFDLKTGSVKVQARLADENVNWPSLTVYSDGLFEVRS